MQHFNCKLFLNRIFFLFGHFWLVSKMKFLFLFTKKLSHFYRNSTFAGRSITSIKNIWTILVQCAFVPSISVEFSLMYDIFREANLLTGYLIAQFHLLKFQLIVTKQRLPTVYCNGLCGVPANYHWTILFRQKDCIVIFL